MHNKQATKQQAHQTTPLILMGVADFYRQHLLASNAFQLAKSISKINAGNRDFPGCLFFCRCNEIKSSLMIVLHQTISKVGW